MEKDIDIVVVFSGGMDSTTLLAQAVEDSGRDSVVAMNFDYGSKHNEAERMAAHKVCQKLQVVMTCVELPFIGRLFKSNLLKSGGPIPEGHYEEESMKDTVVPFRNGIMLSIAVGYAESIGAESVWIGNHAGDHAIYPDCRWAFINAMDEAIREGTDNEVRLVSPYVDDSKSDIINRAIQYKAPLSLTHSCYKGVEGVHCGKCGTCVERIEAFMEAGFVDPVSYAIPIQWHLDMTEQVFPY